MAGPSGATSRLALPYPIPNDTVDVPRDVQALADKIEATQGIGIPVVTALPASPVNGQQIIYKPNIAAMGSAGQPFWHMVWDSTNWYYIGGNPAETNSFPRWDWSGMTINAIVDYVGGAALIVPVQGLWYYEFGPLSARAGSTNAVLTSERFGITKAGAFLAAQEYTFNATPYAPADMGVRGGSSLAAGDTLKIGAQITLGINTIVHNVMGGTAFQRLKLWPIAIV